MPQLPSLLKKYFGHSEFRPLQEEIIRQILAGNDALVLMPTGGGKSVCYQLPALVFDGLTVVISPLISLMKDQVDAALSNGIPAACLNSTLTQEESERIIRDLRDGLIKLLYVRRSGLPCPSFVSFCGRCQSNCLRWMKPIVFRSGGTIFVRIIEL